MQAAGGATGFEPAMAAQSMGGMAQGVMRCRYGFEVPGRL